MNIYYCPSYKSNDWTGQLFFPLVEEIKKLGPLDKVHRTNEFRGMKFKKCFILEDEDTYKVIETGDYSNLSKSGARHFFNDEDCELILKSQYCNEQSLIPLEYRKEYERPLVRPWLFPEKNQFLINMKWPKPKNMADKLYFRGRDHHGRKKILDGLRDLLNPDYGDVSMRQYGYEMIHHRFALSLPGGGNLCHREFDAMALGVPVIMPRLQNELFEPLVADTHYIAAEEYTASAIRDRYLSVKDDEEYRLHVINSASSYYNEYLRFPKTVLWTLSLLGFNNTDGIEPRIPRETCMRLRVTAARLANTLRPPTIQ